MPLRRRLPKKQSKLPTSGKPKLRRRKLTTFQTVVKSIYNFFSVLPFVPDPVRKIADIIAAQIGVAQIELKTMPGIGPCHVLASASPYCVGYFFVIRSNSYLLKSPAVLLDGTKVSTNYRAVRPRSTTITVTPQNKASSRSGHYSVAMFPYTGVHSAALYENLTAQSVLDEQWISRARIYRRVPATKSVTLTYRTPKSNTYLHMGVPIQENGGVTINDGVMAVAIICQCDCRASYGNFNADDIGVDVKMTCIGDPLEYDGTRKFDIWRWPIRDVLKGSVTYHNPEKTLFVEAPNLEVDDERKTMCGVVPLELEQMELTPKSPPQK